MLPPTFVSFDGTPIRCWPPAPSPVQPVAKILLVHGLGTHGDSLHFRYLREHLTGKGFAVYASNTTTSAWLPTRRSPRPRNRSTSAGRALISCTTRLSAIPCSRWSTRNASPSAVSRDR